MDVLGAQLYLWSVVISVLLFALFVRRVMGVRLSLARTVLAALIATLVGPWLLTLLVPVPDAAADTATLVLYGTLMSVFLLIMAMFALAVLEMLLPDGTLPGPVTAWRSLRGRLRRTRRYLRILRIIARHGLVRFLRGGAPRGVGTPEERHELARSLRRALEDGGVTFVKLGQQLSTRRDLLAPEFIAELSHLQDDAPALPWEAVAATITAELGGPPDQVLGSIEEEPLAAASVAQVHAATTPDGQPVVLKVQRPGVRAQVAGDLEILDRMAATLTAHTTWARNLGLSDLVAGFAAALTEELDFRIEQDNLATIAAGVRSSGAEHIRVPSTLPQWCTPRVLVMERVLGDPVGQPRAQAALAGLPDGHREQLATDLLRVVLDQVTRHGVFHVDLHPGNLLVAEDGSLAMLDLGSVGRLGSQARSSLTRLLAALGMADSVAAADALLEIVDRPDRVDERRLEQELGEILLRFAPGGNANITGAVGELFKLVARHRLGIPPQLAAAFRAVATLEGTLAVLSPGFDLVSSARAAGEQQLAAAIAPTELKQTAERELATLLPLLRRLPRRMERIADAAEHGRLQVNARLLADPADRRFLVRLWHQALLTVLAAAAGLMSVVLFAVAPGPMVTETVGLFHVLATALLAGSVILVMRLLVVFFRHDEEAIK